MSCGLKRSTGLTGLKVSTNPRYELTVLYGQILRALGKIPPTAAYRRYTEDVVAERAGIVECARDVKEIECKINCGQVAELIKQAESELRLARKMFEWKPWEPLLQKPPPEQWKWPPAH